MPTTRSLPSTGCKQQAVAVGLPATLLLDEKGCELAVLQGPAEWDSPLTGIGCHRQR